MSTAVTSAYAEIRQRIQDGSYPPGLRLRENQLVADLGVSRTPIREALRRLHAEGLVITTPNKGARVASWSEQDFEDVFEMRILLESYAARLAAQRAERQQIERLEELAAAMEQHLSGQHEGFHQAIARLNNEFHGLVVEAAGSGTATHLLSTVVAAPVPNGSFSRYVEMPLGRRAVLEYTLDELHRSASHHRELISALKLRDPEWAEAVIRTHILASRGAIRGQMESNLDAAREE
jgi:DNA-binding GntR family transcriptional regulator